MSEENGEPLIGKDIPKNTAEGGEVSYGSCLYWGDRGGNTNTK